MRGWGLGGLGGFGWGAGIWEFGGLGFGFILEFRVQGVGLSGFGYKGCWVTPGANMYHSVSKTKEPLVAGYLNPARTSCRKYSYAKGLGM